MNDHDALKEKALAFWKQNIFTVTDYASKQMIDRLIAQDLFTEEQNAFRVLGITELLDVLGFLENNETPFTPRGDV